MRTGDSHDRNTLSFPECTVLKIGQFNCKVLLRNNRIMGQSPQCGGDVEVIASIEVNRPPLSDTFQSYVDRLNPQVVSGTSTPGITYSSKHQRNDLTNVLRRPIESAATSSPLILHLQISFINTASFLIA